MAETTFRLTPEQVAEIKDKWLRQCGPCDFGLPTACACPEGDYRPVMSRLLHAFETLQRENTELRTASLHRLVGMVPTGRLRNRLAEWVADQQQRASGSGSDLTHLGDAPATPVPAAEEGAMP